MLEFAVDLIVELVLELIGGIGEYWLEKRLEKRKRRKMDRSKQDRP